MTRKQATANIEAVVNRTHPDHKIRGRVVRIIRPPQADTGRVGVMGLEADGYSYCWLEELDVMT